MKHANPDRPPSDEPLEGCTRLGPEDTMPPYSLSDDVPQAIWPDALKSEPVWLARAGADKSRPVDWGTLPRGGRY